MRVAMNLVWALFLVTGGCQCQAEPAVPGLSPLAGVVFINEFMASNRSVIADEAGDYDDWVELYNAGDSAVLLRTMFLTDDIAVPTKWTFPDTFIAARGYLLVWCDGEYKEGPLHTSFKLNAAGEQLGLFWASGDRVGLVDTLSFGPQCTDTSFGRLPDGSPGLQKMPVPTPGRRNSTGISGLAGRLYLNEFMASNQTTIADEFGDYDDWIEIHNAGDSAVRLQGLTLTDDFRSPTRWPFPDRVIPARGFVIVWADDEEHEGPLHASFNLSAVRGEQLGLYQMEEGFPLLIDTLSFGPQRVDTSFGRLPDGGADWQFLSSPTPGRANQGRRR